MISETRLVETFNTHLMQDEVVRALSTGRDDELTDIMRAIRQAAAEPDRAPPALIMYGERGSGKSFLMRLVQLECAAIPGLVCVLLPEEQYNIRTPQKILQAVASQARSEAWTETAWEFDSRSDDDAWTEELAALHDALDVRFGAGKGLVVVLLENLDLLFVKLFGASVPPPGKASAVALSRQLAEERLRKLMTAPNGRFMLVASATGTVDMDYERPLFMAFRTIDLQPWDSSTAIRYYNKRRELLSLPALSPAEQARAAAVTEFTGGNARLTQLLGTALSTPDVEDIANIFDNLVDQLADYYRQRLDALPPATAGLLDALIRGGEPVTQSGLAQRVKAAQPQIADAFSYLIRSRLVQASGPLKPGGGQLFKVRDRLFVHFYRRRYGQASALTAIAELLERVLTPDEREAQIRNRLLEGNYRDIAAFGHLSLSPHSRATGYCPFRDRGITDGPDHFAFALTGLAEDEVPAKRRMLRENPAEAYRYWHSRVHQVAEPLRQAAASSLAAIALSRMGQDKIADHELRDAFERARACDDADAMIVTLDTRATLIWNRRGLDDEAKEEALLLVDEVAKLRSHARHPVTIAIVLNDAAINAFWKKDYLDCADFARQGLQISGIPQSIRMHLLEGVAYGERELGKFDSEMISIEELYRLAVDQGSVHYQIAAIWARAHVHEMQARGHEAIQDYQAAAEMARSLDNVAAEVKMVNNAATIQRGLKETHAARATANKALELALALEPPESKAAAEASLLVAKTLLDEGETENAPNAIPHLLEALRYASESENVTDLIGATLDELIFAGSRTPSAAALGALKDWLVRSPEAIFIQGLQIAENWPWAVAKANAWPEALALAQAHPDLLTRTPALNWRSAFRNAAKPWVDAAEQQGRAAAYALASAALPAMRDLWILRSAGQEKDDSLAAFSDEWGQLIGTLISLCHDSALLKDLADLFDSVLGPVAEDQISLLRSFAELHAAPDKELHLQQTDPDLALMMRRVLNIQGPADALDARGRKRSR